MLGRQVFCIYNDDLSNIEALRRGFRGDIFAQVNSLFYQLAVYDITRLRQDFESEVTNNDFFDIEPNIILVKQVERKDILNTINKLFLSSYFDRIKPSKDIDVAELSLL